MPNRVGFDSPYYPYEKILARNTMKGAELIPYKILNYLLDLPDAYGYQPVDDNERPRVRLLKFLCHDTANPLAKPLPTPEQKLSLVFDPDHPDINTDELKAKHPFGYRLFMQRVIGQSGLNADTILKCYIRNTFESQTLVTVIGVTFEVWSNVNINTNTRTTSRDRNFAIEQCLHEALDGVNMAGIGTITFHRGENVYNGSEEVYDSSIGIGRIVTCSVIWEEGGGDKVTNYQAF